MAESCIKLDVSGKSTSSTFRVVEYATEAGDDSLLVLLGCHCFLLVRPVNTPVISACGMGEYVMQKSR
jgi:hypothetical protein